jgi:hypothetical protein
MRAIMIAMWTTTTLGLAAPSTTIAAPASGNAIVGAAAISEPLVQKAQFSRRSRVTRCVHRVFSRRVCETVRRHR